MAAPLRRHHPCPNRHLQRLLLQFLRHKSLRTTEVYLRKPDESLRDAAKRLENAHLLNDLLTNPVQEKEKAT